MTSLPEELHLEILKRLLPTPQVLARASAVCREWRRLVNDPGFLHEMYRARRGAPLTLGFFHNFDDLRRRFVHVNASDPVRIAFEPFAHGMIYSQFMDCCHGRVLLYDGWGRFVVWHPITGDHVYVEVKGLRIDGTQINSSAALICECAADEGGDDGPKCHVSHFRVAVVSNNSQSASLHGKVFSSLTGLWSESAALPHVIRSEHCVVVGKTLYQPLFDYLVLAFDMDTLSLTTFERPKWGNVRLLKADGGVLGLAGVLGFTLRTWVRHDDAWVMRKTVDLREMLGVPWLKTDPYFNIMSPIKILGVTESGDALFLWTMIGIFMLCLESMVIKKMCETTYNTKTVYPYGAFYLPPAARIQRLQVNSPHM